MQKSNQIQTKNATYTIVNKLGEGRFAHVSSCTDDDTGEMYAVKIFKEGNSSSSDAQFIKEIKAIRRLEHPNIIQLLDENSKDKLAVDGGKFLILEAAQCDFLKFISLQGALSEGATRFYFRQLMSAIEHCHLRDIAHRDIKLENLLLADDYNLKVADFGFASDANVELNQQTGTDQYLPPEVHMKWDYRPTQLDLFGAGVVLFMMLTGRPPFQKAETRDPYYKALYTGKEKFWKVHEKRMKKQGFFNGKFKDLIRKMLNFRVADRMTIEQIKGHPWYNQPTPLFEKIQEEIKKMKNIEDEVQDNLITPAQEEQKENDAPDRIKK